MPLRFHLDESVHLAVAEALRRRGIDVTTPHEVGLLSAADEDHLAFGHAQNRVVITHDSDFLRLAAKGRPHSGIAFCRNQALSVGEMVRTIEILWLTRDAEEMQGRIEFL